MAVTRSGWNRRERNFSVPFIFCPHTKNNTAWAKCCLHNLLFKIGKETSIRFVLLCLLARKSSTNINGRMLYSYIRSSDKVYIENTLLYLRVGTDINTSVYNALYYNIIVV